MSSLRGALWLLALGALAGGCGNDKTDTVKGQISLAVRTVEFGEVPVLNTHFVAVEVQNVGRAPLSVESVTIKEEGVPFKVEAPITLIAASETQKIVVSFKPPKQLDYAATLVIASDDEKEPSIEVKLTGRGSTVAQM